MGISSVNLVDIQTNSAVVGDNWSKAVSTLVTSLKKNHVCLVNLPPESASSIIAASSACEKFFEEDGACKREFSYMGARGLGYREEPTREVFELPVPQHVGLRTPACLSPWAEQAYTVLDRTARTLLQALCMSSELELSPYALFPLLDYTPCSTTKISSSTLEISRHLKAGTGASAADELEGALPSREDPGILTLVSAWEQGLQVKTSKGVWLDVPLSPNQVAVLGGYTLWHATAGLMEPSVHRMLFRSRKDTMMLSYQLAARSSAVIDTQHIMAESGHPIPDRFRQAMPVKDLMHIYKHGSSPLSGLLRPGAVPVARTPSPPDSRPMLRTGSTDTSDQFQETGSPVSRSISRRPSQSSIRSSDSASDTPTSTRGHSAANGTFSAARHSTRGAGDSVAKARTRQQESDMRPARGDLPSYAQPTAAAANRRSMSRGSPAAAGLNQSGVLRTGGASAGQGRTGSVTARSGSVKEGMVDAGARGVKLAKPAS